jgi:hypothetical protein
MRICLFGRCGRCDLPNTGCFVLEEAGAFDALMDGWMDRAVAMGVVGNESSHDGDGRAADRLIRKSRCLIFKDNFLPRASMPATSSLEGVYAGG